MSGLLRHLAQQALAPNAALVHPLAQLPYATPMDVSIAAVPPMQRRPPVLAKPAASGQAGGLVSTSAPPPGTASVTEAPVPAGPPLTPASREMPEPPAVPELPPSPAAEKSAAVTISQDLPTTPQLVPATPPPQSESALAAPRALLPTTVLPPAGPVPPEVEALLATPASLAIPDATISSPQPANPMPRQSGPLTKVASQSRAVPSFPPPLLASAATATPRFDPATLASTGHATAPGDPQPTEVHVHIGRIEVTAVPEAAPARSPQRPRPEPMSLDQYLSQRQRERT